MGREVEQQWIATHREVLRSYVEEWVCVEGEQLIAHSTLGDVVKAARRQGILVP